MATEADFAVTGLAEPVLIAVDNGGTNTRVQANIGDNLIGPLIYPTPRDYGQAIIGLAAAVFELVDERPVDGIGFAVAGRVRDGQIISAGELQDYGWVGQPFQEDVATEVGLDIDNVRLLNDCVASAKAQQSVQQSAIGYERRGYVATNSTGFGGAGFTDGSLIADEPGHKFLRKGMLCGCGKDGCVEACISGSGIERNYKIRAEDLPNEKWDIVMADAVEANVQLLHRLERMSFEPEVLFYFGSVAMRAARFLPELRSGLTERRDEFMRLPQIRTATHGDNSGLVGAYEAALGAALGQSPFRVIEAE